MGIRVAMGVILSFVIAEAAYRKGSLSKDGKFAAYFVGSAIFAFGSIYWYGLLLFFFFSSTLLSRYRKEQKRKVEDLFAKTGRRDAWQVMANGGLGVVVTILNYFLPSYGWMAFYLGILSTVNADTWGTELGVLSSSKPRHILTWNRVEKGTSGGVSSLGMVGTFLGALFMGASAMFFYFLENHTYQPFFLGASVLGGVGGALVDSLLGATIQEMYFCRNCHQQTERISHCGRQTDKIRGIKGMNNDVVNLLSSVAGGSLAWLLYIV
ncbi:MAG TPA: DUF92 domain-containing protein [Bacillota bacterium]|nr:DUF92 domain-containing protein [Bacillota bacterium]